MTRDDFTLALEDRARFRVVFSTVGYGTLGVAGTLGFNAGLTDRVLMPPAWGDLETIAAHAPSKVEIDLAAPAAVFGFLNASAQRGAPVGFWIDSQWIGDAAGPCEATPAITLAAGRHLLEAEVSDRSGRHSCWALRAAPDPAPQPVAVVTVACYPLAEARAVMALFFRSARRQGLRVRPLGIGTALGSLYQAKVERLTGFIAQTPGDLVLFADGRDVLFAAGADEIRDKFLEVEKATGNSVLIGAERECWPCRDRAWADRFPAHPSGRNWINSGMYIGRKAALLEVLDALRGLHEQLEASDPRLAGVPHVTTSDQFMWQLYHLHNPGTLALDQGCHIFANVTTEDQRIGPENTVYEFQGGRVVMRVGGQRPCLLHFSGRAAGYSMAPWAGYLGLG